MEFASVALSTLLPKLAQLLQDEYGLQTGAKKGIQFLYEELERTQAALRQVGEVPLEELSELVRLWARDVREVSYDMEDIVDTFMVRVQGPDDPRRKGSAKEFIKKMFNAIDLVTKVKTRRDVAKEIKGIKERVKEVAERRDRYLIVTDNIWDIKHWEVIVLALIENNMSSRIIITTRIIDVAKEVSSCYMLKPLSPENSEKLFHGRIFGSKDKCQSKFLDVSEKILKKCGGVPLAIGTTSSLLANKSENLKVWHDVCDSIGSGLEKKPGMDSMMKILLLSYYDLPSHLKTCLLYLSIFPEDYEIEKDRLIWRWVAEGFVQGQQAGDQSFLKIGESYLNELVNRSLIQPAVMNWDGTFQACHVHDMVLDLIISLSTEESFIAIVFGDGKHYLGSKEEVRRLSLHNYIAWPTINMSKLRGLTIFETPKDAVVGSMPSLRSYHLLRVLDLRDYKLKDLASMGFLGSLSHLRYLGLSTNVMDENRPAVDRLPMEIGKLQFLQTLDMSGAEVEEVPSSIIPGLRQLTCLRGDEYNTVLIILPNGLKDLTSLEVLESAAVASECIAKELGYLTQLRVLKVMVKIAYQKRRIGVGDDDDEWSACANAFVESLGKLKKIESLCIINNCLKSLCYDGSTEEPLGNLRQLRIHVARVVPTWIELATLPGLTHLNIRAWHERKADIQVLNTLPCLRHLRVVLDVPEEYPLIEKMCGWAWCFPMSSKV